MCHASNVLLLVTRSKFSQRENSWNNCEFLFFVSLSSVCPSGSLSKSKTTMCNCLVLFFFFLLNLATDSCPFISFLCCRLTAATLHNSSMLLLWPLSCTYTFLILAKNQGKKKRWLCLQCHAAKVFIQLALIISACLSKQRFVLSVPFCSHIPIPPPLTPPPSLDSVQPVRKEWWTRSLFASVSHQLQPYRVLHLSTPDEALAQQTVLLWWVGAGSSRSLRCVVVDKLRCEQLNPVMASRAQRCRIGYRYRTKCRGLVHIVIPIQSPFEC